MTTAYSFQDIWKYLIEYPLFKLGLMESFTKRFFVVSSTVALLLWTFKPNSFFDEKGNPRPWSLLSKEDFIGSIPMNWFIFSLFVGTLFILFV